MSRHAKSDRLLVTGGTRGIGRAIALTLARAGADVVATSRREDHVRKVTEEIKELGKNLGNYYGCDASQRPCKNGPGDF